MTGPVKVPKQIDWARKCMKSMNLITVFNMNQVDGNRDLDNAMLKAILNGVLT